LRIALIYAAPSSTMYPLALLKIGAMLKSKGHKCGLFVNSIPPPMDYEQAWVSTCFTYDTPKIQPMIREIKRRFPDTRVVLPQH
jgi:hypothetical protein